MKTASQLKQEKLYILLQENNLQLSLADLIEFTYHQYCNDYIGSALAVEHMENSRINPVDLSNGCGIKFINDLQNIGFKLSKAHRNKTAN